MKKIKAIIFDLDRTILNLAVAERIALEKIYNELLKCDYSFEEFLLSYNVINEHWWQKRSEGKAMPHEVRHNRFKDLFIELSIETDYTIDEISNIYMHSSKNYWRSYPNVIDILEILLDQNYRLGIITNGFTDVQKRKIDHLGINHYFSSIVMSDDLSIAKPDKRIFHHSLKELEAEADEAVYIGDDYQTDVIGSANAGLNAIWFNEHQKVNHDNFPEFHNYTVFFKALEQIK
jgi:putative hydrolase of the HAD superfamily